MASIKEQRAKLQEKIAALQAREKTLAAKEKEKERKARTKRLIEIGAVVESVAGQPIQKEQLEKFKQWLTRHLEQKPVEKENPSAKTNGQESQSVTSTREGMPPSGLPL